MNDLTEEQQVEQLRAWWKENGTSLLVVLAVGIAGSVGWLKWQDSKQADRESVSVVFEQAVQAAARGDSITLSQRVDEIEAQAADSAYLTLAKLREIGVLMAEGEATAARDALSELLAAEKGTELEPLIAVRLARAQIYLDDPGAAIATLADVKPGRFQPFFNDVRGDAYVALNQVEDARAAYQSALDDPGQPQLIDTGYVSIKLAELATQETTGAVTP